MPLKWQSHEWRNWYFEKKNNSKVWFEIVGNRTWSELLELSIESDANGDPIVYFEKQNDTIGIKLFQGGVCFYNDSLGACQSDIAKGYWTKKYSTKI